MKKSSKSKVEQRSVQLGHSGPNCGIYMDMSPEQKEMVSRAGLALVIIGELENQASELLRFLSPETKESIRKVNGRLLETVQDLLKTLPEGEVQTIVCRLHWLILGWILPEPFGLFSKSKAKGYKCPIKPKQILKAISTFETTFNYLQTQPWASEDLKSRTKLALVSAKSSFCGLVMSRDVSMDIRDVESDLISAMEEILGEKGTQRLVRSLVSKLTIEGVAWNQKQLGWEKRFNTAQTRKIERQGKPGKSKDRNKINDRLW